MDVTRSPGAIAQLEEAAAEDVIVARSGMLNAEVAPGRSAKNPWEKDLI